MKRFQSRINLLLAFIAILLVSVTTAFAQTNTGVVRGEVKDIQGASIPRAEVTLTNQDTHVSHTDVTNATGGYLFPAVDPGTYTLSVAMPGFKKFATTNNIVTLDNTSTVDAVMQIGATTDTIEVSADSLTLNTANVSGGQLFNEQQLQTLPSLGRNPFMFATLDANVVTLGDPRYVRAEDSSGSSQVSLSGAPSGSNSYVVDGIPVSTSSGGETFVVSPDAVSDAKVQADTFDAEIARSGGGVFNTSFKTGTAQYHGELYGETRQTGWSANNYFNYAPKLGGPVAATPNDATYLYSGAFGGPVPFSQKNRWTKDTFFWITEEGYRQGQPNTGTNQYYVPTLAERTGDFSAYAPANGSTTSCAGTTGAALGACYIVYDPTTSPTGAGRVSYLQETGKNAIPAAAINTIGQAIANDFPVPTGGAASAIYGGSLNYSIPVMSIKTRSDEYVGKVEHIFAPWWTASASYLHNAVQEPDVSFILSPLGALNTKLIRYFDATSVTNTFTLNPTTLLTVGYGFNRYYSASPPYSTGFNQSTGFNGTGFPGYLTSNEASKTFPSITLSNTSSAAALGGSYSGPGVQASHNLIAILSKTIGKNDLRFGYGFRAFTYYQNTETGSAGAYTFSGQNTNSGGTSTSSNGPLAIADLLVGQPNTSTMVINAAPFYNKETYNSLFAQDDYRLSSKLTVNAGIRYEYELGQFEAHDKFNVGFSSTAASSYVNNAGVTQNLSGGLLFAGVGGAPIHCCQQSHFKFSPRIGAAYQVMDKTVIHIGYGLFYAPIGIVAATQGFSQTTSYAPGNTTAAVSVGAAGCLSTPFNGGTCGSSLLQPSGSSLGPLTAIGNALGTVPDSKRGFPLVQQYMLDVERQLPYDTILKVSYIGAHASSFLNTVNINQIPDSALAAASQAGTNLATKVTNPLYAKTVGGYPSTGVISNATYAQGQFLLPFPQYTSVNVSKSDGFSWYNSLSFKAEKRVSTGLTALATYTWSSNWDNLYGTGSQVYFTYGPQDNTNINAEYARSINSIPNRVTMAITYDLPVGKGRKYLANTHGFVGGLTDAVVGGWQVNYEHIIQNGVPISVIQTDLSSGTYGSTSYGGSYQRPNLVGDAHNACVSGRPQSKLGYFSSAPGIVAERPYLNISAFTAALPYQYGDAPRSLPCRAPGSDTATASINKSFTIHEQIKFQFRIEALNLWNTPQFGYPTTTITVAGNAGTPANPLNPITTTPTILANTPTSPTLQTFGNLNTQIGFSRVIQMGGRITF